MARVRGTVDARFTHLDVAEGADDSSPALRRTDRTSRDQIVGP
jgi:hypothetical protein